MIWGVTVSAAILMVMSPLNGQPSENADVSHSGGQVEEIYTRRDAGGMALQVIFDRGKEHNHPLMAVWIEDTEENFLQTLYVAESIGKGVFTYGDPSEGKWKPGPIRRPAALPYWGHQRGIQAEDGYYIPTPDNPVPDAITGPTPKESFVLHTQIPDTLRHFNVLFEINQSWNWNDYWTNTKYPDNEHYMTSSQPAVVYMATINRNKPRDEYRLEPIGHGHWSGQNGNLYEDLSTLTTALEIAESVRVIVSGE